MSVTASLEEKRLLYGWLRFRPSWLQFLNTPKWFLFFLGQYFFTQSVISHGMYPGTVSTIQKRFAYSSFKMGMIQSSYDIAAVVFTPFVSFFGGSRKKPVFCGLGLFLMAVGVFIFTLPHFISSPYEAGVSTDGNATVSRGELCTRNLATFGGKTDCAEDDTYTGGNNLYYAMFILGMVVAGIGGIPKYSLGIPYIDENVKAKAAPMYFGIFVAFGIVGAAAGFVLSPVFLSKFVEFGVQTSLTPDDTRWVGNWWLGFAIFGGLSAFWSLWFFAFPKEFPLTRKRREEEEETKCEESTGEDPIKNTVAVAYKYSGLRDLPKATKMVFTCFPFVFITIGACLEEFIIASVNTFGPKLLEAQFYVPAGRSALLYGVVAIPVALFGNMLGAYINKRLNLNLAGAAKMCFIVACISLGCTCLLYIKCDTLQIAGVNMPYLNSSSPLQLDSKCNQACNCTGVNYDPVCGGPLTYFSPCYAGCDQNENQNKSSTYYQNCACVMSKADPIGKVEKGLCQVDCGLSLVLLLIVLSAIALLTFLNDTPAIVVTLRSLPAGQQAYALGLQSDLTKILGAIPAPIIFGALIDQTCILWDTKCGERGFCLEYDHDGLAKVVLGVLLVCKGLTTTTFFLSWFFSRRQAGYHKSRTAVDSAL